MSTRWRITAATAAVIAALIAGFTIRALTVADASGDLSVYDPHHNRAREAQGLLKPGVAYTFETYVPLCTKDKPVTIRSVELAPASGFRLDDWALWPTYGVHDLEPGSARRSAFALSPVDVVNTRCTAADARQQLAVSMTFAGSRGAVSAFKVYSSSGAVTIHFPIAVCTTFHCPFAPY